MNNIKIKIATALGIVFFFVGIFTLTDYGINWDTINHLPRGQAYLHYFLTGKKDYSDLPLMFNDWSNKSQWYWQNPKSLGIDANISLSSVPTRSMYQIDAADFNYFMGTDGDGHPPLSDILSSAFNRVLFGKLRLINDIDSYRVYGVFLSACLVGLIFYWVSKRYGKFAGIISSLSLAMYPLFFSETHFNTEKDIPEAVYWSFMLFAVWKGVTERKIKWILISGVLMGLALGTKFNILFIPFIIFPWLLFYLFKNRKGYGVKNLFKTVAGGIAAIFIGLAIFIGSWPYLWPDVIGRIQKVIGFYKQIGTTNNIDPRFVGPFGTSTYPLQWIIYTTPPIILFFTALGIVFALRRLHSEKDSLLLLFLLWFLIPIVRVIWHGADIYGGIRQIMEYIPGMAILSGVGAAYILNVIKLKKVKAKLVLLFVVFAILVVPIVSTHPNENAYFNSLIGGLSGAKLKNFPYYGFTFGGAYRKGIEWVNDNSPKNSKLVYAYELIPNIPRIWVRPDIEFQNANRSGYLNNGEYAITLNYQGTDIRSYYDSYLVDFVKPTFTEKVDGIPVLSVWRNDKDNLKTPVDEVLAKNSVMKKTDFGFSFDIGSIQKIWRLEINYKNNNCKKLTVGYDEISSDGSKWARLPGVLPDDWRISYLGEQPKDGHFIEPFIGQSARYIDLFLQPADTCLRNIINFKIYYLK